MATLRAIKCKCCGEPIHGWKAMMVGVDRVPGRIVITHGVKVPWGDGFIVVVERIITIRTGGKPEVKWL